MSTKLVNRQKSLDKPNDDHQNQQACISKRLYEDHPQSRFFLFNIAYKLFHFFLTYLSKYVVGQNIISIVDFFVEKLEKTLDFCIVKNEIDDVAHKRPKTAKETVHPIIWLMFLPALLWLRMFFFWASVVSIILGKGEVTAYEVQVQVKKFRRYYRSVRFYAVDQPKETELQERDAKAKRSMFWWALYTIEESIFMRRRRPFCEDAMHQRHISPEEQTDQRFRLRNSRNVKKNSLNDIDGDGTSGDEEMKTVEMLEQYSKIKDSPSVDPDYEPEEEPSSEEVSSDGDLDTEEEKTESQRKLNVGEDELNLSKNGSFQGYSSDHQTREKSKKKAGLSLNEQELAELENQLVMKIMKHFKSAYNYTPTSDAGAQGEGGNDVFYSPIGSPPERTYISDSEVPTVNKGDGSFKNYSIDDHENEVTSSSP